MHQLYEYCKVVTRQLPVPAPISVIATCQSLTSVHSLLRESSVFQRAIEISAPNHSGRVEVIRAVDYRLT